ncbi:MAG: hypothetical protein ACJ764_02895 [Solirubrobacteraceae bacterium]
MRPRFSLLAAGLVVLVAAAIPGTANAAPRDDQGLTITATPNPVNAGDGVLIYGQLAGPNNAGQPIKLYHHLAGSHRGYVQVGSTTTDSTGFYELPRAEGVVWTNRSWFVRGPNGTHSHIWHEGVIALVSLTAQTTSAFTNHSVLFTGAVTPNHSGEYVYLQQQIGSSDNWKTLRRGRLAAGSQYSISYRWRRPGVRDVRVVFRGDVRNLRAASDPVTVEVQQTQVPDFTINTSQPVTPAGSTVTISGTLDMPATTSPEPDTPVQLWGRIGSQRRFRVLDNTTTDSQGQYSFTQAGERFNAVYYVATLPPPHEKARHTARLNQGVQDALTMQASATSVLVGESVTFTGTVVPDKAGRAIYLQKMGRDGRWHVVRVRHVTHNSTYLFNWKFGAPGTFTFRVRIISDGHNVGAHSAPATITATLPPPSGS